MLFPPYLIHSQSTSAAQETTRLGCQDLGFLDLPEVKAGYTKKMTNKGRHLAGGTGNLVSPPGNKRKQVSLPAPAQKMATTYILSQLCVTKEYLNNTSCPEITCKAYQGPHEPSWDRGISQQNSHQASAPASRHTTPTSLWNFDQNNNIHCDIKCALNLNMNQPTFFIRFEVKGWGASWDLKDPISVGWPGAFSSESSGGISTPGRIGVTPGEWLQAISSKCSWNLQIPSCFKGVLGVRRKMPLLNTLCWYFFELFHYDHSFVSSSDHTNATDRRWHTWRPKGHKFCLRPQICHRMARVACILIGFGKKSTKQSQNRLQVPLSSSSLHLPWFEFNKWF